METQFAERPLSLTEHQGQSQQEVGEDSHIICPDQFVLLKMPSGNVKAVRLKKDTQVSLGKFGNFDTNSIIGHPYGYSYEIYEGTKAKIIKNVAFVDVDDTEANNKDIVDDPAKQNLSHEEIERMKQEGVGGQEIIKKVVEGHSTFNKKTEYSKAKYIKRKEAKFSKVFTPVKPTLYSVWSYVYSNRPEKIRDLRIDTLSQILTLANVHANAKYIVVDDVRGMLISGVMERLGGYGFVLGIHEHETPNYDIIKYMNFTKKITDSLKTLSWIQVFKDDNEQDFLYKDESKLEEKDLEYYLRKKMRYERLNDAREALWQGEFDGLLVASQYQPKSILEALLPYVAGSRPIVIYSIHKEVLVDAFTYLRMSKQCINPEITESWLRNYQVLPGRTHPEMTISGGGGYILHAKRIINNDDPGYAGPSVETVKRQIDKSSSSQDQMMTDAIE
ncbi:4713_t:CDS:10 [Paraglomus occultum]|uniref:tRNA (adenine(58)-N(1))-methyltransferase non-catalytic subunit TRM6 n=1 Tax=Paraglomus occultum TaxID=144539 RepID=A0A9N8YZR0_9GLOM|nr:4713_t:CDS:10 [Paraglomus occultum]